MSSPSDGEDGPDKLMIVRMVGSNGAVWPWVVRSDELFRKGIALDSKVACSSP
ncbi:unnamed protein product [Arabidopsis halleri]